MHTLTWPERAEHSQEAANNPYWVEVQAVFSKPGNGFPLGERWASRHLLVKQYAWAIPDPDTLHFVAQQLGPRAVEIGAGTGYWAWLLCQLGVDIIAYDIAPPDQVATNGYHSPYDERGLFLGQTRLVYHPILQGGPEQLSAHTERTLFLCWPPYNDAMAARCLEVYQGHRLVYIGESSGGCTGDERFFEELGKQWHITAFHWPTARWDGIHDWVQVYERGAAINGDEEQ